MRRMTVLALVAVIALLGAACGGDDDDAGNDTEASDDGGNADDNGSNDDGGGDDGGGTDAGNLSDVIDGMGGCSGAAAAVSAAMFGGFDPSAADQLDENNEFFDEFEDSVPDDIKEDVELFASYVEAYSEVFQDIDPSDFANPEEADDIQAAFDDLEDEYPQEELDEANQNISDWFTEECPALAGG